MTAATPGPPPDPPSDLPGDHGRPRRTRSVVAAELADVERYLTEVPPHQSGGLEVLERRRAALQRELAALRASGDDAPNG